MKKANASFGGAFEHTTAVCLGCVPSSRTGNTGDANGAVYLACHQVRKVPRPFSLSVTNGGFGTF